MTQTPSQPGGPAARKCPICGAAVRDIGENKHFPFCSQRCQTIDLGRWAKGDYKLSRSIEEKDLEDDV